MPTRSTLVVAPYIGEFGWELMNWQGRVRRTIAESSHDRVVICAEPDRRSIYTQKPQDERVVFCPIHKLDLPGHRNEDHRVSDDGRPVDVESLRRGIESAVWRALAGTGITSGNADLMMPSMDGAVWSTGSGQQRFVDLRVTCPIESDIVLVPRLRSLADERNRPMAWWHELKAMFEARGARVAIYQPQLGEAIRQLSGTRLAVGASTGGLHLAALCRCPHYVWGCGGEDRWTRLGMSNRQRYETLWNPFGTRCRYDECGWQPPMTHVVDHAMRALDEIGVQVGRRALGWSLRPMWRVRRTLAWLTGPGGGFEHMPWRVKSFVREHLV